MRKLRRIVLSKPIELLERRTLLSSIYVDAASPASSPDGSSWSSAFQDLEAALSIATSGDKILIAGGTYKPTGGTDRTATFQLKSGVELDGGYAGNALPGAPNTRNSNWPTILSGDIGAKGDNSDNSYHVLTGSGADDTCILDGLTVSYGNDSRTDGQGNPAGVGGALYINDFPGTAVSAPLVRNCSFTHNFASEAGGAVFASSNTETFTACVFFINTTSSNGMGGGAMFFGGGSTVELNSCGFFSNASRWGGALSFGVDPLHHTASLLAVNACTFVRNTAAVSGGAVDVENSPTCVVNSSTFNGNTATSQGGGMSADGVSRPDFTNCSLSGNSAGNGAGVFVGGSFFAFSSTFADNQTPSGALSNIGDGSGGASGSIINCIFWGDQSEGIAPGSSFAVTYSDTRAKYSGAGDISSDPQFVRNPSAGTDGVWGTLDDDYGDLHLQLTSPCIDAGTNNAGPALTTDSTGLPRYFDVASVPDTGNGAAPIIDMGAYEAQYITPRAVPGGPYSVFEGASVVLDGSQSSEAGGSIVSYQWDLNYNGSTFNGTASGKTVSFSAAGLDGPSTRTIALKVTDGSGQSAIATATVNITDAPPTAKFTGGSVTLGSVGSVAFASQSDPSPADVAAGFKYSYDFNNDGAFEITDSSSASATVPATYLATAGNHTIRGRIKDKDGGFAIYTATVAVTAPTKASVSGTVFADNNGNAKLDTGETGVSGRKLYIDKNKNGVLDSGEPTFTTGANGAFTFSGLAAGTYRIRDVLPAGWRRTSPMAGYFDVTVTAGQTITGKNFAETTRGLISGTVFKDANGNGIKDSTEVGLSGWVVYLDTNNNGKLDPGELSVTTGSDGKFSFIVPAGTYHLREVLKTGFKRTTPSTGVYNITLSSGQTVTGKNFGDH